jgi:hypothetical protein
MHTIAFTYLIDSLIAERRHFEWAPLQSGRITIWEMHYA